MDFSNLSANSYNSEVVTLTNKESEKHVGHPYIAAMLVSSAFVYTLSSVNNNKIDVPITSQSKTFTLSNTVNDINAVISEKITNLDEILLLNKSEVIDLDNETYQKIGELTQNAKSTDEKLTHISTVLDSIQKDVQKLAIEQAKLPDKSTVEKIVAAGIDHSIIKATRWIVGTLIALAAAMKFL